MRNLCIQQIVVTPLNVNVGRLAVGIVQGTSRKLNPFSLMELIDHGN